MSHFFKTPSNFLRKIDGNNHSPVTPIELFFDLVFVFTVIQLSHTAIDEFTPHGLIGDFVITLEIWLVWIYTTWHLNFLNPHIRPVQYMIYAMMLTGLFLSSSIPEAFGERGLVFGASVALMQFGRSFFVAWASSSRSKAEGIFYRTAIWTFLSGLFWISGGLFEPKIRLYLWITAVSIEFFGPMPFVSFWVPYFGRFKSNQDWQISGLHMVERCSLFVIICVGESILSSGMTFNKLHWNQYNITAFILSFVISVFTWWLYFKTGHEHATEAIKKTNNPGHIALIAYHFAHIPIVLGLIFQAVARRFLLTNPTGALSLEYTFSLLAGTFLFLLGSTAFKGFIKRSVPIPDLLGLAFLILPVFLYPYLTPMSLTWFVAILLFFVGFLEYKGKQRKEKKKA